MDPSWLTWIEVELGEFFETILEISVKRLQRTLPYLLKLWPLGMVFSLQLFSGGHLLLYFTWNKTPSMLSFGSITSLKLCRDSKILLEKVSNSLVVTSLGPYLTFVERGTKRPMLSEELEHMDLLSLNLCSIFSFLRSNLAMFDLFSLFRFSLELTRTYVIVWHLCFAKIEFG